MIICTIFHILLIIKINTSVCDLSVLSIFFGVHILTPLSSVVTSQPSLFPQGVNPSVLHSFFLYLEHRYLFCNKIWIFPHFLFLFLSSPSFAALSSACNLFVLLLLYPFQLVIFFVLLLLYPFQLVIFFVLLLLYPFQLVLLFFQLCFILFSLFYSFSFCFILFSL